MVRGTRIAFAIALACAGASASAVVGACKVVNTDHCANKDDPGNDWCRALSSSTPYCSPCEREFHGCVSTEPFACPGYVAVIDDAGENGDDPPDQGTAGMTAGMTMCALPGGDGPGSDGADPYAETGAWGGTGLPADAGFDSDG